MNWFEFSFSGFLAVFVVLNVVNVLIQTVKSIATIKCGAWGAASVNALAYGLYTVVVVYMSADGLGLLWKAIIIAVANLFGVYIVKVIEEKKRKDKLWRVEATVKRTSTSALKSELDNESIPNYYNIIGNHTVFACFCKTQKESAKVRGILARYEAKYFVSESKTL